MAEIKLTNGIWSYDDQDPLGKPGGFGEVFKGCGPDGALVAVKRLKFGQDESAAREIRIAADLSGIISSNLVPVLDYGCDLVSGRYYLIMPRCEYNLEDWLTSNTPSFEQIVEIATQVLKGLKDANELVHRDLKPSNILRLNDNWAIADFGIAKYAEESTSLNTLKDALSPQYAAPEQWKFESATDKTDVYALGCILYRLVNGSVPFSGTIDECRDGHLNRRPESLRNGHPVLRTLILQMLRKTAAVRPSLCEVDKTIRTISAPPKDEGGSALQIAASEVESRRARHEATKNRERQRQEEFGSVCEEGIHELEEILQRLGDAVMQSAPNAEGDITQQIVLGRGTLKCTIGPKMTIDQVRSLDRFNLVGEEDYGPWHIAAYATISVRNNVDKISFSDPATYSWDATLIYCPTDTDTAYHWREVALWYTRGGDAPVGPPLTQADILGALSSTATIASLAYGPKNIDGLDESNFQRRWSGLLALASSGRLLPQSRLPISDAVLEQLGA